MPHDNDDDSHFSQTPGAGPHSSSKTSENSHHTVDSGRDLHADNSTVGNTASDVTQASHDFDPWPEIPVDRMDYNTLHGALSKLSLQYSLVSQDPKRPKQVRKLYDLYSNAAGSGVSHLASGYERPRLEMERHILEAQKLIPGEDKEGATECRSELSKLKSFAPAVALIGNIPVAKVPKYEKGDVDRYWQTESSEHEIKFHRSKSLTRF
jgi:hypothetical protein